MSFAFAILLVFPGGMMKKIKAAEVGEILRGRMGLIAGPELSAGHGTYLELSKFVAEQYETLDRQNFIETAEACLESGEDEDQVKAKIRSFLEIRPPSSMLSHLAKVKWNAVLSASLDIHLENRLQQEADRVVSRKSVSILYEDSLTAVPPHRTVPSYKLLGGYTRNDFMCSRVQYLHSRTDWWRIASRGFCDAICGTAVLCAGMSDCTWILEDLLATLVSQPSTAPSHILLLSDDPLKQNSRLERLLRGRSQLVEVDSTLGELATAIATADRHARYSPTIHFPDETKSPYEELRTFEDFLVVVNEQLTADAAVNERERLLDLLFAPTVANWSPFVHDLDFGRTLAGTIVAEIQTTINSSQPRFDSSIFLLHGPAATGKTVMLKRVALDLAKAGRVVIWLKLTGYAGAQSDIRKIMEILSKNKATKSREIILFIDDPVRYAGFSLKEVKYAARAFNVRLLIVVGVRTTDRRTGDIGDQAAAFDIASDYELSDELDDQELNQFPAYLVKLGIYRDEAAASSNVRGTRSRRAQDTLSLLYYLLPATRTRIASSIRDEFFRLGDRALLSQVVIGDDVRSTELLRDAYAMVAVAEHYEAPLPYKVLVSALKIDFQQWRAATPTNGLAWGILYAEELQSGQTNCLRTRNAVVANELVKIINGGTFGHAGEVQVMQRLLGACDGSMPAYRNFCIRVLVPHGNLANRVEYHDGLQLYNSAIAALPHEDRTILHHKGLWIKDRGGDPVEAKEALLAALRAKNYPYAERVERDENIYTSLAANEILIIEKNRVDRDQGKRQTLQYLDRARSADFFDPRTVHVQANLLVKLASKEESRQSADTYALASRALSDVDRTLLILGNPSRPQRNLKDLQMLAQIRDQVYETVGDIDEMRSLADQFWADYFEQRGFVLVARKLYHAAWGTNKGSHFRKAYEYCLTTMARIREAGHEPAPTFREVLLHIYYKWQIQRRVESSSTDVIAWESVRDHCRAVLGSLEYANDPFAKYLYGLALAHLGAWSASHQVFDELKRLSAPRDLLGEDRDFLLHENGGRRRVQGVVKRVVGGAIYLYCEDLGTDFRVDQKDRWPNDGEIAHSYVTFSFRGFRATLGG